MKNQIRFLCLALTFLHAGLINAESEQQCIFMDPENETCSIKSLKNIYSLSATGLLEKPDESRQIQFKLPENIIIETVQFKPLNNKIVFTFQVTDGDSGSTLVSLYNESNHRFEWQTELFAFNTSPALIYNEAIYLGGIGIIAKLDLNTGKIIWQHIGLYERETQAYNAFVTPKVKDEFIIFREQKVPGAAYRGVRQIKVLDRTGKIISK